MRKTNPLFEAVISDELLRRLRERQRPYRRRQDYDGKERGVMVEWGDIVDIYNETRRVVPTSAGKS